MSKTHRKAVIRAAANLFDTKGEKKTTYAELASASGVDAEKIKSEFTNKTILALEVQAFQLEELKQHYLSNMPDASPRDAIKYILRSRIDFTEHHRDRTFLFFLNAFCGKQPWSDRLDQVIWQFSVEFASFIERGIREGLYKKDTDVNIIVRAVTSIYLTGVVTFGLRAKVFDSEVVWNFIEPQLDMVFDSIHV